MLGLGQSEKGETGEEQIKGILIIFFDIKGIIYE
jgi:hypothetical protein